MKPENTNGISHVFSKPVLAIDVLPGYGHDLEVRTDGDQVGLMMQAKISLLLALLRCWVPVGSGPSVWQRPGPIVRLILRPYVPLMLTK